MINRSKETIEDDLMTKMKGGKSSTSLISSNLDDVAIDLYR